LLWESRLLKRGKRGKVPQPIKEGGTGRGDERKDRTTGEGE